MNAYGDNHISYNIGYMQSSSNGIFLLCKTDAERVILFVKGTGQQIHNYYGAHSDNYTYSRCCFSNTEKYIYASHHNDFIIWDIISGNILNRIQAHSKTLRDMVLDNQSGYLITVSFDRAIKIWCP